MAKMRSAAAAALLLITASASAHPIAAAAVAATALLRPLPPLAAPATTTAAPAFRRNPASASLWAAPYAAEASCVRSPAPVMALPNRRRGTDANRRRRGAKPPQKPTQTPRLQLADAVKAWQELPVSEWAKSVAASVSAAAAEVRPLQLVSGFALALVLVSGTVVVTTSAITDFLSEGRRGQVVERAILFGAILEDVNDAYVEKEVDLDKLFQTGVNAMLSSLDPYSAYENARQAEDLSLRTSGRYGGVGLTIGRDGDDVLVLGALEGFAFDAGVRPGDRIVAVDGQPVRGDQLDSVKAMLRGEPGTHVDLDLTRDGAAPPDLSLTLARKEVRLPDISLAAVLRPGVGYVKLDGFTEGTAEEMSRAIRMLMQDKELEAIVLDLRDNPGGLLEAAVSVSQQLVPQGTPIVSTSGRVYGGEGSSLSYTSTKPPLLPPEVRLVVLVNGNTASAAEIVTGVVQDTDRGVVVGQRTFGKGLVQIVEPLPGGASLKLTVAKYYTPSGRCIQAVSYSPATAGDPTATGPTSNTDADADLDFDTSKARGQRVAEESRLTFRTANGRPVRSAGGIDPDAIVESKPIGELERSLIQQGVFFKYAGLWLQQHAGPPTAQQRQFEAAQESTYRDFVRFARKEDEAAGETEPHDVALRAKLKALEEAVSKNADRSRSARELQVLRQTLVEEEMQQFSTQKEALAVDLREAVLTRITPPSQRAATMLSQDPQVVSALDLAVDADRYSALLRPPPDAFIPADTTTLGPLEANAKPRADSQATAGGAVADAGVGAGTGGNTVAAIAEERLRPSTPLPSLGLRPGDSEVHLG